jgi:hypothetical protein
MSLNRRFALIFGIPLFGVVLGLMISGGAIIAYVGPHSLMPATVTFLVDLGGVIALVSFVLFLLNIPVAIYLSARSRRS